MPKDDYPFDPIAELDQALAGLKPLALLLHRFYVELTEAGFAHDDAMALTVAQLTKD